MATENTIVLLVEDHKNLAEAVGNYLESCGITVDFAYDGLSGMHLATTNLYDAIILDPPTFGRGARGEVYKIDRALQEIDGRSGANR